jgi:Transposase domain (DUF772)
MTPDKVTYRGTPLCIGVYHDGSCPLRMLRALDFIEKRIGREKLLASIERALELSHDSEKLMEWRATTAGHLAGLKPRQRNVMERVLAGPAQQEHCARSRHQPANTSLLNTCPGALTAISALDDLRQSLKPFYGQMGRPTVDPELMIRMLTGGYCMGIRSERRLCEEVQLNLAYCWFCQLGLDGRVPDHAAACRRRKKVEILFVHLKRIRRLTRLRLRGPNGAETSSCLRRPLKTSGTSLA